VTKIYACYTDSHLPLLEQHFLPSLPAGFDLVLRHLPQSCPEATYDKPGWGLTMQDKVDVILDAVVAEDEPFVVSDVDVRFYDLRPNDVRVLISRSDVVYQLDQPIESDPSRRPKYCAGFCLVRPCPATYDLYRSVRKRIPDHNTEQEAIYAALADLAGRGPLVSHLPPERFWCVKHGEPTCDLAIDHASWVDGVPAKLEHLGETRDALEKLKKGR
jgi:hypothetical protein